MWCWQPLQYIVSAEQIEMPKLHSKQSYIKIFARLLHPRSISHCSCKLSGKKICKTESIEKCLCQAPKLENKAFTQTWSQRTRLLLKPEAREQGFYSNLKPENKAFTQTWSQRTRLLLKPEAREQGFYSNLKPENKAFTQTWSQRTRLLLKPEAREQGFYSNLKP